MNMSLVLASALVSSGYVMADQEWDPTSPADTAKQQDDSAGEAQEAPLAGPDVQSQGGGERDAMRPPENAPMGGDGVQSLLARRCGKCHGPEKQEAGVRVVPIEMLFDGDSRDWVVVPGNPEQSELLARVSLPREHEDIMPTKGEPLSEAEVTRIREWIKTNGTKEKLIEAAGPMGGGGNRVDPRTWAAVYMSLELTSVQRQTAMKTLNELRSQIDQRRRFTDEQKDTPRPGSREAESTRRGNRQQRQLMQQKIAEAQEALWAALTPSQQTAMRTILEDPQAIKQARKAHGGRAPSGQRRPGG
ncbi:MAG: c-type cytochrome domain-containing protein [Phycisphaerales bacterium]|jgi:hypothetical protein|nr:c-type cytochrome domain-containing protein [Phycisphaerales bacterium]